MSIWVWKGNCTAAASSSAVLVRFTASPRNRVERSSVHLGKNVFRCFHPDCGIAGDVLDLWAAFHRQPLDEAALHLAETLGLPRNSEEGPGNAAVDRSGGRAQKRGR